MALLMGGSLVLIAASAGILVVGWLNANPAMIVTSMGGLVAAGLLLLIAFVRSRRIVGRSAPVRDPATTIAQPEPEAIAAEAQAQAEAARSGTAGHAAPPVPLVGDAATARGRDRAGDAATHPSEVTSEVAPLPIPGAASLTGPVAEPGSARAAGSEASARKPARGTAAKATRTKPAKSTAGKAATATKATRAKQAKSTAGKAATATKATKATKATTGKTASSTQATTGATPTKTTKATTAKTSAAKARTTKTPPKATTKGSRSTGAKAATAGSGAKQPPKVVVFDGRDKFHRPDCRFAKGRGSEKVTKATARRWGYEPCSVCNP